MSEIRNPALRTAAKELRGFFASPAAYLFLGAFLAITLFLVFWLEGFFARNVADLRPLFQWMPLLLIFLVAALTMRAWSEERRAGTLESLITAPVSPLSLILGKFLAALGLVALALLLTLPLPFTVAWLGPLDWGPVIGGYVASLFLAAAYVSIGLTMSSQTDNPVVALILTTLVCLVFYLIGADLLTSLFAQPVSGFLALLGTGARFESITRGVLDLRDLYYYLSLVGVFLALNRLSLEKLRWAGNPGGRHHRLWRWVTGLTVINFLAANVWLAPISWARIDITEGNLYTLSEVTRQQLQRAEEPLRIRGYFSAKTHPLLAPLVPRLKDLLREYAIAGGDRVEVRFLDPTRDPEVEERAASRYGIKPVPLQTASRYQSSVVNAYFDVVIAYGDETAKLGFRDLIEVKREGETELDVALRNPEYTLTRAIRKVMESYRSGGNALDTLDGPVTFTGYLSAEKRLPEPLRPVARDLKKALDELQADSAGKLKVEFVDPSAEGKQLEQRLQEEFGFTPRIASLLDPQPFWFHMVLRHKGNSVQVPLPETLDQAALKRSVENALERLAPGFMRTLAVLKPSPRGPGSHRYQRLITTLRESYRVVDTDLKEGQVPTATDMLLVLAPESLNEKQLFAIDQFLMRGGRVFLASSPIDVQVNRTLSASEHESGLKDWLAGYGLRIKPRLVVDERSIALPVPTERTVGGLRFREIQMMPYPLYPDLRGASLNADHPITASLQQLSLGWPSPIEQDPKRQKDLEVTRLLQSSPQSWTSGGLSVLPDYQRYPRTGFATQGQPGRQLLAVSLEGRFESYFKDRNSPLLEDQDDQKSDSDTDKAKGADKDREEKPPVVTSVIERSPASAKLVLVASNTFASDSALALASQSMGTNYTRPVAFLQNAIEWAVENPALLALRGQSRFARTLAPLTVEERKFWEYLNYGLAIFGVLLVWGWRQLVARRDQRRYQSILAEV